MFKEFLTAVRAKWLKTVGSQIDGCLIAAFALIVLSLNSAHAQVPLLNATKVSAGFSNTCALTALGGVKCWGLGRLEDGSATARSTPVDVAGLDGVTSIGVGSIHACALTAAGGVKCWGDNSAAQLGDKSTTSSATPVDVAGLVDVTAIAAGGYHTCALTTVGGVRCWGNYTINQPDGTIATIPMTPSSVVSGLESGVMAIAAGREHTCALTTAGGVKCWGDNSSGQLGSNSTLTGGMTPAFVTGLATGVTAIAAGLRQTCALTTAGGVMCWGYNNSGGVGDGSTTSHYTPVNVAGLANGVTAIAAGEGHNCALTAVAGVKCWGYNTYGMLGDNSTLTRLTPVDVAGLANVTAIAAGRAHSCALTTAGGVKCWGYNNYGQLGDNTQTNRLTPVEVLVFAPSSAPSIGTASAGNAQVTVSFTAPGNNGGAVITGYTVTASPGGILATGSGSPVTVTGLSNGTAYTFSVTATNSNGTSAASAASNVATPAKANQTLTFGAPMINSTTKALANVGGSASVNAYASSSLAVSYSSLTPAICSLSGNTVTGVSAGTCTIAANQAGDANFNPAAQTTLSVTIAGTPGGTGLPLTLQKGWNLLGNGSAAPMDVAAIYGDATKITTVWKWNKARKWALYAPSMTPSALASYAQGKGYDVLTSIASKEGFWVNASSDATLNIPAVKGATIDQSDLQSGWNLMGSADGKTPSQLNQGLNNSLSAADKAIVTSWAWDAPTAQWKFYAPSLEAQGAAALADYITGKGYLPFSATLSAVSGFWLNIGAATHPALSTTVTTGGTTVTAGGTTTTVGGIPGTANGASTTIGGITTFTGGTIATTAGGVTTTTTGGSTTNIGGAATNTGSVMTIAGGTTETSSGGITTTLGGTSTATGGTTTITGGTTITSGGTTVTSGGSGTIAQTIGIYSRAGPVHRYGSWNGIGAGKVYYYGRGGFTGAAGIQQSRTEEGCAFRNNGDGSVSEMEGFTEKTRYDWEDLTLPLLAPLTPLHLIASHESTGGPEDPFKWVDIYTSSTNLPNTVFRTSDGRLCVDLVTRAYQDFRFSGSWDDFSLKPYAGNYKGTIAGWTIGGDNLGFDPYGSLPAITMKIGSGGSENVSLTIGSGSQQIIAEFTFIDNREYHPPLDLANMNTAPVIEFPQNKYRVFNHIPFLVPGPSCMYLQFVPPVAAPVTGLWRFELHYGCRNYDAIPGEVDNDGYIVFDVQPL